MHGHTRHSRALRPQSGMALVECLIAILIFAVGVVGLMGLEARVVSMSTASEDRSRAALLAGEISSLMWLNNSANPSIITALPAYTTLATKIATPALGGLPGAVVTIVQLPATTYTNGADISITWVPPSEPSTTRQLTTRVVLP